MIILRNGSQTEDPRLDRLVQFDERSRAYPIRTAADKKPLKSYTWRCNAWLDQGREGACVAYSLGHELAARVVEVNPTLITNDWLIKKVYWEAQKIDPWEGGSYPGASPKYEGTSVLCGVKVLQSYGFFNSYRWGFGIDDVLYGLGHNGPAVLGIAWYEGMYSPDGNGFVHPNGNVAGGHAILARAINVKEEFVTLHNSWGSSWGKNGDCYITFEDLNRLLKEDGEAVFVTGRNTKAKPSI